MYYEITISYYEKWLGQQGCLTDSEAVRFIYTNERNAKQAGYPSRLDLYVWVQPYKTIISFGDAVQERIDEFRKMLIIKSDISKIYKIISSIFECDINHSIKYLYKGTDQSIRLKTKILKALDYADYEIFFLSCFPDNDNAWLRGYFDKMIKFGYCVGIYADNILVSCTDAPSMPYMEDVVQEIGINTLPNYRGKGYATAVCIKAVENIIASGKVPQWSTTINNFASQNLAERVGFVKLSDVLMITL